MRVCLLFLSVASVGCLGSCDREEQGLEIKREYRALKMPYGGQDDTVRWKELENGLFRSTFRAHPAIFQTYPRDSVGASVDPFADPVESSTLTRPNPTPKEFLEDVGITFEGEASATYNRKTQILTVDQTKDRMKLVETYVESFYYCGSERQLYVRAEIYELPSQLAQEAIESASPEGEHTPERDAVVRAVKDGRAILVSASALICRSGQRAKVSQLRRDLTVGRESDSAKIDDGDDTGARDELEIPVMEFEVDPVLGADGYTVDLNFSMKLSNREGGSLGRKSGAAVFQDDEQSVTTMVTMKAGQWLLVGNWAVEEGDQIRLLFLSSTIQDVGGYSQLDPDLSP